MSLFHVAVFVPVAAVAEVLLVIVGDFKDDARGIVDEDHHGKIYDGGVTVGHGSKLRKRRATSQIRQGRPSALQRR